jgi:hypothetical protein
MKKQYYYYIGGAVAVIAIVLVILFWRKDLSGNIVIPFISHQQPKVDPHLPSSVALADKLDEVLFEGIFNISANPSGITYEDGLGELVGIDDNFVVTIRLKNNVKWHDSYNITVDDDDITVSDGDPRYFSARDLNYTLKRIQRLGSLSPDYILVSQAVADFSFDGPNADNEIRFKFRADRTWLDDDIKEVLSFKVLPQAARDNESVFNIGSGPYMTAQRDAEVSNYVKNPSGTATLGRVTLEPFIDNSTFTTELSNGNINTLLETPFGSLSPILADAEEYFHKSNISTVFFAVLFNTERLDRNQRVQVRRLLDNEVIHNRFYKLGSEQQRHIADYKGNKDNYTDYLNYSVFPTSTYYVDEQVVMPQRDKAAPDLSVLPDTVRVAACLNFGFREEYRELIEIMNDPALFKGKGNYDAVLVAFTGYRSTFLFDLYDIFLREPDLERYRINLVTTEPGMGTPTVLSQSFQADRNFFRLDARNNTAEQEDIAKLLEYIYEFMATREIGDKQAYSRFIDELEYDMALGSWLFSLPSLSYFSTQFDANTIDLYGVASQLSTIEKWQERKED